jgi:CheY-like chemotaxis protein
MDTAPFRILMVEDDGSIAQLLSIAMHTLDVSYQLDRAFSAEEGLALWNKQPYDLLLTDYNLRGMTGIALIETLKQQGVAVPMVLFTAYDTPRIRNEAQQAGVAAFITKPFFLDDFVSTTRELLPARSNNVNS